MHRVILALLLTLSAASAQTAPQSDPAAAARPHRTLVERFDAANTTHDGHLTQEQARSHMPAVARNFAAIDTTGKGYVTVEEIRAYNRARNAARRAAKQSGAE